MIENKHDHAIRVVERSRMKRELRKKKEERRRFTTAAVIATAITYALTWAHYGMGY